jgi:iron(III) transport system ATP-binding protein
MSVLPGPTSAPPIVLDGAAARESVAEAAREQRAALVLEQLTRRYGERSALESVSLEIAAGEILCLLGPSGSGKSTLLRLVAGLERPSAGRVILDGVEVAGPRTFVEPERRRVGMVFQDYALFPHLTVAQNIGFGVRRPAQAAVAELLDAVGLPGRGDCYPHTLSGGERQRVALARALAPAPRILLLDEPFSGLDGRLRDQIRRDTLDVLRRTRTTTVLVTHDAGEALRLADRIALLERGALVQVGRPDELYRRPASLHAARTFGTVNLFAATCRDGRVDTPLGDFAGAGFDDGAPVQVCIRPQHVRIGARGPGIRGRVVAVTFLGDASDVAVAPDGSVDTVVARVPGPTPFHQTDEVYLTIDETDVLLLP